MAGFNSYGSREEGISRRQEFAKLLREQSMTPSEGQMVSGRYVAPSWTQGLARLLQAGIGAREAQGAIDDRRALEAERTQALAQAIGGYSKSGNPKDLLTNPDTMEFGLKAVTDQRKLADEARMRGPRSREVMMGSEKVTQEYNPETGEWGEVARGAAFAPKSGPASVETYRAVHPEDASLQGFDAWQRANKQAGAISVNTFGSPVAGVDDKGNPVFFQPTKDGGPPAIVPGVAPPPKNLLSAKDANTVKAKIASAEMLKQQIADARAQFEVAKKTKMATGIVGGMNPLSEEGKKFDAAINSLRSTVTALTRTPGVGSMSDYETRLDQGKIPRRDQYDSVTEQQLKQLEDLANGIISGYSDMAAPSGAANSGLSADEQSELEQLRARFNKK